MQEYSEKEMAYLLSTARRVIKDRVTKFDVPDDCPGKLLEERACFVSIYLDGDLRGCIGSLTATEPLIINVMKNAYNAAFEDQRFIEVDAEEVGDLDIEISILTEPKKLSYSDSYDLLDKLNPPVDGVVLSKDEASATFLPVVWDHFKIDDDYNKIGFLTELCLKAGLDPDDWKEDCEIEIYHTITIAE